MLQAECQVDFQGFAQIRCGTFYGMKLELNSRKVQFKLFIKFSLVTDFLAFATVCELYMVSVTVYVVTLF